MLTIEYSPNGTAYSDFVIQEVAKEIIETHLEYLDQDMIFKTSTESLFQAIRLFIVENDIDSKDWLRFKFENNEMIVNKFGNPDCHIEGFCDISMLMSCNILKKIRKRKEETQNETI